jgi:hypothetical protein
MSQTPWIKDPETALFLGVSKKSHGEEVTKTDSEKPSHFPQDVTILTFSRTSGEGNKRLQDKIPVDVFCHFGQKGGIADVLLRMLCD